jgi:uncharacterized repeat protein (TIGR01451 family)
MKKLTYLLASVAAFLVVVSATAYALGQIEGGNIYRIINKTQGSDWIDPNSANPGDNLTYRVRIHNPGPDCIQNVFVKATLPQGRNQTNVSLITVRADNVTRNYVTDSATLNLSSAQTLTYQSGSTQLLDANRQLIRNLPDGILGSGIGIGNVCVSINEKRYVQFNVKVSKPSVPAPKPKPTPTPAPVGKELPNTGPGEVAGLFAGASALGAAGHFIVSRRRR